MTKTFLPLLLLATLLCTCGSAQEAPAEIFQDFPAAAVRASLPAHRVEALSTRRFKQEDLQPLLSALGPAFTFDTAGRSVEGRPLYRVTWGEGEVPVLLWSQMHGDEPTATAALFDLFSWLEGSGDGLDSLRTLLRERLQLTFLPMLNPDGAARYERRNALGIDLNRDALHLSSPEARLLKGERDRLDAAWGFNLHDQSVYYGAGFPTEKGCVISILAPAYDWEKTMNESREDAARLIGLMNALWQEEVPGQIGRYNDDFEPRAFGDNLQKWGTRTILIESGGMAGDPEKQEIRRLNVLALIAGLHGIASGRYRAFTRADYEAIPENESNAMHHLKLVNAQLVRPEGEFRMDIGFRIGERSLPPSFRNFSTYAYVSDLGDLHTFGAFTTVDLKGAKVRPGKTHPSPMSADEIKRLDPATLYAQGYTSVQTTGSVPTGVADGPLRILKAGQKASTEVGLNSQVDLLVYGPDGKVTMAVVNGKVW
ncbi:M14 family zinc carboxypeptidase [Neolewinella lacunae]|uniref:Peptidase M14 n=1 Tax=Neolewinella lacunae TaxID=1517758 RepID=A0A923T8U4_9BACT|nr:M14 family zinc carboxypeptidase [Neolewinella lacunae]MBC6994929.1 peptidase M14 [Neolewinella lacunae]MDN3633492.1 M14 family zinc carboxypeptidase [Neolewinella lacunae]